MDQAYWLVKIIGKIEEYVASILLLISCLVIWLQFFCRSFLNSALPWPEELSIIFLIYFVFIGAGALYIKQGHITVDWFVQKYIPNKQELVFRFIMLLNMITFLLLFYSGLQGLKYAMQYTSGASILIPRGYLRFPLLIMSASCTFTSIVYSFIPFEKIKIEQPKVEL